MFYEYRQNNSGGRFDFDKAAGVTVNVIIEADSAEKANEKMESLINCDWLGGHGGYCSCCGDRWYPCGSRDGKEKPEFFTIYRWMEAGFECCIHYADGKLEWL